VETDAPRALGVQQMEEAEEEAAQLTSFQRLRIAISEELDKSDFIAEHEGLDDLQG